MNLGGLEVRNPPAMQGDAGDVGSIPRSGRSLVVGNGILLQYSCPENFIGRGTWQAVVHGGHKESDMTE